MNEKDPVIGVAERWVRPEVRAMRPYAVHDASGLIKLDAMENPYTFPRWLLEKWLSALRQVSLNRYPDASAASLKACLRETYAVPAGSELILGNGSDELIQMLALAVGGAGDEQARVILAPEPTFVMYRVIAATVGMRYVGVPLMADFSLDLDAMLASVETHQPALVFLAFPNNPTGNLFELAVVENILQTAPGLVVVDEAYFSFAAQTLLGRLAEFPNLVVMRTLSKMGLAGLRLGWMAGHPEWMREVEKVRLPYNIGSLTQVSTRFALEYADLFEQQTAQIVVERDRLSQQLKLLSGIEVFDSAANFVLFRVPGNAADQVFDGLKQAGLLIKNLNAAGGALKGCLRVTAGTPAETAAFLTALQDCWP